MLMLGKDADSAQNRITAAQTPQLPAAMQTTKRLMSMFSNNAGR